MSLYNIKYREKFSFQAKKIQISRFLNFRTFTHVASRTHRSSEQSLQNEPQNSSTSKRVLLPLEPDFSQISDPSIDIALPSNTWVSDNRHTSPRCSRRDLPKDKQVKEEEKTQIILFFLLDLQLLTREAWLSWMHRPTGDQEVVGSTPAEVGNILSWRLIMKYFLRSFSPADSRRAVVSFWGKNVHTTG